MEKSTHVYGDVADNRAVVWQPYIIRIVLISFRFEVFLGWSARR